MTALKRKRPLDRTTKVNRDARLIVIATEGTVTERFYFEAEAFRGSPRVQVEVLETKDGCSSPKRVLSRLADFKKTYQIGKDDILCLAIDRDRWEPENLAHVARECLKKGFRLAVSNPRFELWLLLHFEDASQQYEQGELEERLRVILGAYNKRGLRTKGFTKERIRNAIRRAEILDEANTERWPQETGSHVFKIVKIILEH